MCESAPDIGGTKTKSSHSNLNSIAFSSVLASNLFQEFSSRMQVYRASIFQGNSTLSLLMRRLKRVLLFLSLPFINTLSIQCHFSPLDETFLQIINLINSSKICCLQATCSSTTLEDTVRVLLKINAHTDQSQQGPMHIFLCTILCTFSWECHWLECD